MFWNYVLGLILYIVITWAGWRSYNLYHHHGIGFCMMAIAIIGILATLVHAVRWILGYSHMLQDMVSPF